MMFVFVSLRVRATFRSLGTFSLSLSSIHAPVGLPLLVFVLLLGVRLSESIQLLLLFPMCSCSPLDLLISFPKLQCNLPEPFNFSCQVLILSTFSCCFSSTLVLPALQSRGGVPRYCFCLQIQCLIVGVRLLLLLLF